MCSIRTPPAIQIHERVIHIGIETRIDTPERVCVYFRNGSRLDVLGTATNMEISNGRSHDVTNLSGEVLMRPPIPSLSITVSGDIKLAFFGVEEQPVNISTLEDLI